MNDEYDEFTPAARYDIVSEAAILGAIMETPCDEVREAFLSIPDNAWYQPVHGELAKLIRRMLADGTPTDVRTVNTHARDNGIRENQISTVQLFEYSQQPCLPVSAEYHADRIRKLGEARSIAYFAENLLQRTKSVFENGTVTDDDALDMESARAGFDRIVEQHAGNRKGLSTRWDTASDEFFRYLDQPFDPRRVIPTPWPAMDDALAGGFHSGRTYLFAARPGAGKSLALTNAAAAAAASGHAGVIFSAEMGVRELVGRIMASGARAEYGQITRRSLDSRNRAKVDQYARESREMPLYLVDKAPITIDEIRAEARRLKKSADISWIAVDYIQLLKAVNAKLSRQQQIGEITRALKQMSMELDIAVISACQLNRDSTKEKRRPTLADLRESGDLEQDSDVVVMIHHLEQEDGQRSCECEFVIAKNRAGAQTVVPLEFRGAQATIANPSRRAVA